VLIAQANGRRTIADLLRAPVDSRGGEMRDMLIHQCLAVGGHSDPPIGTIVG
jgi:hypothetical protein